VEDLQMSTVRLLVVTDDADGGFQRSTALAHKFHLGEFVQVLQDTAWQGFDLAITRATRWPVDAAKAADLYDFRFSPASLAGFDMVFFLSIASPGEEYFTTDTQRRNEAAAIAAFMEQGGGFFATGDHEDLGASINQHVPRVRSMRRWSASGTGPHGGPPAPSGLGADRHDTLQAGSDVGWSGGSAYAYQFNDQSDDTPQPVQISSYDISRSRWFRSSLPHPLLCSPLGRIEVLPDHMHEGWCEVPVDLSRLEELPGRESHAEYPSLPGQEPLAPEVIAWGTVLPHATLNQEFSGDFALSPPTTRREPFGQIAVWDGHRVQHGRVVVQSTWHHFININLIGTQSSFAGLDPDKTRGFYTGAGGTATPAYQKIQAYYRNLVYWLIPAERTRLLWANELAQALRLHPRWEEFKGTRGRFDVQKTPQALCHIVGWAQLAEDYFQRTRGHCVSYQLLPVVLAEIWRFDPRIWEELAPETAPWDSQVQQLLAKQQDLPGWQQALLPDARLRWQVLLGTLAMAVGEQMLAPRSKDPVADLARRMLAMLPGHLNLLAQEMDEALKLTQERISRTRALADRVAKAGAPRRRLL
jgi:hypothetical protein